MQWRTAVGVHYSGNLGQFRSPADSSSIASVVRDKLRIRSLTQSKGTSADWNQCSAMIEHILQWPSLCDGSETFSPFSPVLAE